MITSKRYWVAVTAVILGMITFIPEVPGQQPIDTTSCSSTKITTIVSTPEFTIYSTEARGVQIDNLPSKTFDNLTFHSVGVFKVESGKVTGNSYSKYMDASEDFFLVETQVGTERVWKYIYGTGKWKGITGGGTSIPLTKGKPISPGTSQGCNKVTGTYELKK